MAGNPQLLTITGPWKGLELDESRQTPQHDEISINVDYSRGRKEARKGFEYITTVSACNLPRIHLSESANGLEQCLLIMTSDATVQWLFVATHNGVPKAAFDLTTLFGEPRSSRKQVGFLNVTIPTGDVNGVNGNRKVTLISTEYSTYVFDPTNPTATPRRLSTALVTSGGDAMRSYLAQFTYWSTVPHGPIMEAWQSQVFYAGFRPGEGAALLSPIESNQNSVPEDILTQNRAGFVLQPWMLAWSDTSRPADVSAVHILQMEDRRPITGLKVLGENLYVFTSANIYVLISSGNEESAYANAYLVRRVVSGIGCVAPRSIVENQGVLYFMASDGIYAFGGLSTPGVTKVTVPIDPIFSGRFDAISAPAAWQAKLGVLGWPFIADQGDLRYSEGLYVPSQKQIWWSLPVAQETQGTFSATLVLDLVHRAWSVWCKTSTSGSCMGSGVVVQRAGQADMIYAIDNAGYLCRYGSHRDTAPAEDNGVPLFWRTPRLRAPEVADSTWLGARLKMLSLGRTSTSNPPSLGESVTPSANSGDPSIVLTGEASSWDAGRTEVVSTITTHPWAEDTGYTKTPILDGSTVLLDARIIHSTPDWFTSTSEGRIKSQSIRIGVKDDPLTDAHGNLTCVASFSVQADPEGIRQ